MMVAALVFAALGTILGWGRPAIGEDIADPYGFPTISLALGGVGMLIA